VGCIDTDSLLVCWLEGHPPHKSPLFHYPNRFS